MEQEKTKRKIPDIVFLLVAILLACAGALFFRQSMGIWMMIPVFPFCVALAAFLPVKRWEKAVFTIVMVGIMNTIELQDNRILLLIVILAAVTFALVEAGIWLIRKKKLVPVLCGILALLICLGVLAFFLGNPFSALSEQEALQTYIQKTYDTDSGNFSFTNISYDISTGIYSVSMTNNVCPTESAIIYRTKDFVIDRYRPVLEDQQMRDPAVELTKAIRVYIPDDVFTVHRVSVSEYGRDGRLQAKGNADLSDRVSYCVEMSGKTNYEKLQKAALRYANAVTEANVQFRSLCFIGMQTFRTRYRIAAAPTDFDGTRYLAVEPTVFCTRSEAQHGLLQRYKLEEFLLEKAK